MKKFTGALLITTEDNVIGYASGMDNARGVIEEYVNDKVDESAREDWLQNTDIFFYTTIGTEKSIGMKLEPGELDLGELPDIDIPDVYQLEVLNGYLGGNTYGDEDELARAVKEAFEDEDIDLEGIENMRVRRIMHEEVEFELAEVEEPAVSYEDEYTPDFRELSLHSMSTYVNMDDIQELMTAEINKYKEANAAAVAATVDNHVAIHDTPADAMADGEIEQEIKNLEMGISRIMTRKYQLEQALNTRKAELQARLNYTNDPDKLTF